MWLTFTTRFWEQNLLFLSTNLSEYWTPRFKFTVIIFCLFYLTQTIPHAIIRLTIYSVQEKTVSIVGQGFSSHDWVPVITYDKLLPFRVLSHRLELKNGTRQGSLLPPLHLPAPLCRDHPQLCPVQAFCRYWNYPSSFWCNSATASLSPSSSFPPSLALDLSLHAVS